MKTEQQNFERIVCKKKALSIKKEIDIFNFAKIKKLLQL